MFSVVASISITAVVSISAMVATIPTIAMVMVSSIVMAISMPITITMTIAVVTISMAISTIAIVVIAWRCFQVFSNLHFFVLVIFRQLHFALNLFRLNMFALWGQYIFGQASIFERNDSVYSRKQTLVKQKHLFEDPWQRQQEEWWQCKQQVSSLKLSESSKGCPLDFAPPLFQHKLVPITWGVPLLNQVSTFGQFK